MAHLVQSERPSDQAKQVHELVDVRCELSPLIVYITVLAKPLEPKHRRVELVPSVIQDDGRVGTETEIRNDKCKLRVNLSQDAKVLPKSVIRAAIRDGNEGRRKKVNFGLIRGYALHPFGFDRVADLVLGV